MQISVEEVASVEVEDGRTFYNKDIERVGF